MKENSHMFTLAYSSPLSQFNTEHNLGCSGEEQLSRNTLLNKCNVETSEECLNDLIKLFHNSINTKSHPFISVSQ